MRRRVLTSLLRALDRRLQRKYEPYLAHFRVTVGYQPSILLPRRYHEKILWRKLIDRSPLIATFCDKLATKKYIADRLPSLRIPETLWTGRSVMDIPATILADKVMIKCNHGCGYNFAWNPASSDIGEADRLTREWLAATYGTTNYEWGYTQVTPRIFVERFIEPIHDAGLLDVSVRAADGRPILASITMHSKSARQTMDYLDCEGRHLRFDSYGGGFHQELGDKTGCMLDPSTMSQAIFREAVESAAVLSRGVDYARFDFMTDGQALYAGEITGYPASGLTPATPDHLTGFDTYVNPFWDLKTSGPLSGSPQGWRRVYARMVREIL